MSEAALPDGVASNWDVDGVSLTLPGPTLSWGEVGKAGGLLWAFSAALMALIAWSSGGPVHGDLWVVLALLPVLLAPFFIAGRLFAKGTPVSVRIEPMGVLRHTWAGSEVPQIVPMEHVRGVRAQGDLVTLEVARGRGPTRAVELRVSGEVHARWLADQVESALVIRHRRQGDHADVPEALRDVAARRALDDLQ